MQYSLNSGSAEKDRFLDWLSQQTVSLQLADASLILTNLEKYCLDKRLIRKPICDIRDKDEVNQLRVRLEGDRLFRFFNRAKTKKILLLLRCYLQYLEQLEACCQKTEEPFSETVSASESIPSDDESEGNDVAESLSVSSKDDEFTLSDDTLTAYFQLNSIPFVDKRPYGGRLWMIGGKTLESDANILREHGFYFCFAPNGSGSTGGQSGWYLNAQHQISMVLPQDDSELSTAPKLSKELEDLLAEDDMKLLRDELLRQNILTLEQFKQINPWGFMNRHVLYSISQRQEIYKRILQRLRSGETADSEQQFALKTKTASYPGAVPAEAFACFCEHIAQKYPLKFRSLLDMKYNGQGSVVLSRVDKYGDSIRLMNPEAYVNRQMTAQAALIYGQWICKVCGESEQPVKIEELEKQEETDQPLKKEPLENCPNSTEKQPDIPEKSALEQVTSVDSLVQKAEKCVFAADLDGMTPEELRKALNASAMYVKSAVSDSKHIVSLNGKLFHDEVFVDWEDGAEQLENILDKLLVRNDGYVSAAQFYEYVHADMQMFLNDNDMDHLYMVYDLARHLFEKLDRHHKQLVFQGNHISRKTAAVRSNLDVMRNYAKEQGGVFREEDLIQYLQRVGIKTGNLRGQMRIYEKPVFLFYDAETYILAESMCIDDSWLQRAREALARLFADMGDHVVLRDIQSWWYTQLPTLPGGKEWTALLLQSVLMHYSEKLDGARTICGLSTQTANTLHAMLVSGESEIQSFPDAVIAFLVDDGINQRRFEGEELRQLLVQRGMIAGSELYSILPKALAKDSRFSWDASQQYVTVKV